jgi:type I restriction enzyme S subunit
MSFSGAERAKYALQTDDVLVSEGSASETAVGAPCRWQGEIGETVCFQNTLLRYRSRPGRTTPAFVDHWCAWAYESGAFREVAGGSNIKHIGARRAELMPVAAIPISEQPDMLAPVEAAAEALRASETHMRSLQALRAAALMALLSGEHEIPESYDELMEVAS